MAGPHIAEKLGIPRIMSVPLPIFTPTAEFPSMVFPNWHARRLVQPPDLHPERETGLDAVPGHHQSLAGKDARFAARTLVATTR